MSDNKIDTLLRKLLKEKNMTAKKLCSLISMTELGLRRTLQNNTIKIETLLEISKVLEVDISYFLGVDMIQNNNSVDTIRKTIKSLEVPINYARELQMSYANFVNGLPQNKEVINIKERFEFWSEIQQERYDDYLNRLWKVDNLIGSITASLSGLSHSLSEIVDDTIVLPKNK